MKNMIGEKLNQYKLLQLDTKLLYDCNLLDIYWTTVEEYPSFKLVLVITGSVQSAVQKGRRSYVVNHSFKFIILLG